MESFISAPQSTKYKKERHGSRRLRFQCEVFLLCLTLSIISESNRKKHRGGPYRTRHGIKGKRLHSCYTLILEVGTVTKPQSVNYWKTLNKLSLFYFRTGGTPWSPVFGSPRKWIIVLRLCVPQKLNKVSLLNVRLLLLLHISIT